MDRLRRALDEYEVAGIKTTLPFFREIIRDEEFKLGKLDTGFISRFNERRAARSSETKEHDQERDDMAVIAAALGYAALRKQAVGPQATVNGEHESRWKLSGRVAGGGSVQAKRGSK